MKQKVFAIALAALLTICCTGCGKKNEEMTSSADLAKSASHDDALSGVTNGASLTPEAPEAAPEAAAEEAEAYDGGAWDDAADAEAAFDAKFDGAMSPAAVSGDRSVAAAEGAIEGDGPAEYDIPDDVIDIAPEEPVIIEPDVRAGLLTAGRWRDHDNWGFFSNLVNNDTIAFPSFGIDPTQRIAVKVTNSAGEALPNAKVVLTQDGTPVWSAVSGKDGLAYVFDANGKSGNALTVTAPDGQTQTAEVPAAATNEQGGVSKVSDRSVEVVVESAPVMHPDMQVMFIVDTTGSMGDEMLYLQSDFGAIAEDAGNENTTWSVSFYKDTGDEYVTRGDYQFTDDVQAIKSQLNAEYAMGGGDEPEAVAEALTEAFGSASWSEDAVKVAFLIYDAPPHSGKEAELQQAIETASEKGIHAVPVVSSNGSRQTELFGRALAICTNGDYVFLTDHSGIGGSHLEPIIGDYEVQPLHDIIVEILDGYRQ